MLRRHKWSLLSFITAAVVATVIVFVPPHAYQYESTATLDVDRMVPTGVIGQESNNTRIGNNDTDQFMSTQIELIRSDSVLRPVARRFKMGPAAETGKPDAASARAGKRHRSGWAACGSFGRSRLIFCASATVPRIPSLPPMLPMQSQKAIRIIRQEIPLQVRNGQREFLWTSNWKS